MNEFVTPLELHSENFNNINGELLPAFLMWDTDRGDYKLINPEINENELINFISSISFIVCLKSF